jgi:integrase/recombinase XerD
VAQQVSSSPPRRMKQPQKRLSRRKSSLIGRTRLKRDQVCCGDSTFVHLYGKGRKERTIPLWAETVQVLRVWLQELGEDAPNIAFPSIRGKPLSRDGVDYLLKRAVHRATKACPSLATKTVSPHVVRHNAA